MEGLLVGIDAGTSATKACAFTLGGRLLAEASVPVALEQPAPGRAEQPADVLESSAEEALRGLAQSIDPRSVAAIGITGQMGGLVLVGEDGRAVSPHLSWLDGRAAGEIDAAMAAHGAGLLRLGGLAPYLAPKAAWWQREHPGSFERAARFVEPAGYVGLRLGESGAEAAWIDRSSSGFAGLFDVRSGEVVPELCALWGIEERLAPRVVPAGEVVGRLRAGLGLEPAIPLVAAPGDGPCGWLGAGAVDPGVTVDTAGTSDHIGICGERFAPDLDEGVLISLASGVEGLWHVQGYTSGTGLTYRWLLETLGGGADELERLAAELSPGSEELVMVPHFGGRVCPYEPAVSGAWVGLTWRHRREHLYRAHLEAVAYEFALYVEAARRLDPSYEPTEVRVIGGGAGSRLWAHIKADVLGVPYVILEDSNYTCWGAALCAGAGVGVLPNLADAARDSARPREVVQPTDDAHERYRGLVELYASLYSTLEPPWRTLWSRRGGAT